MAEYIEREALVEYARHTWDEWNLAMAAADGQREINHVFKMQELCNAVKALAIRIPAADVAPVVHGRWIIPSIIGGRAWYIPHCSACNGFPAGVDGHTRYCPHCGAKMDLKGE